MNEYISRQEVLDLIESAGTWGWSESQLYDEISELATADVRPVVYGEWVWREEWDNRPETHSLGKQKGNQILGGKQWNIYFLCHTGKTVLLV